MPTILRVHGSSGFRVSDIHDFLYRIEYAYDSLYAFEAFIDGWRRVAQKWPHPFVEFSPPWFPPTVLLGRIRFLGSWPPTPETIAAVVPPRDQLVLRSARFESTGSWDFLGKLNPLEVVRQYLNDRHERRKDREYREPAEARKLELENKLLENRVIRERIAIGKELGATEQDLVPLLNELVHRPLRELDRAQNDLLIEVAELIQLDEDNPKRD
jgi:hypothetical protein